ncbi:hypothetical protein [Pontiella desulfatans]|uniref:hypothetical protein n=1 Tax=Pontiella desulfatans TaxID=2750659 RepID=UPI00109C558A|nr:hypothetical protein [Pontiella desulfatans]
MKKIKKLGKIALIVGFFLLLIAFYLDDDLFDTYFIDGECWPHIWRLGGRLVVIGVGLLALAFYKEEKYSSDE